MSRQWSWMVPEERMAKAQPVRLQKDTVNGIASEIIPIVGNSTDEEVPYASFC